METGVSKLHELFEVEQREEVREGVRGPARKIEEK